MTKRTRKATPRQNRIYMLRTMLLLVGIAFFFAVGGGILYVKNQPQTKTFVSDFMKVRFEFPSRYRVTEDAMNVVLSSSKGSILLIKGGTNYTNASTHVERLEKTHLSSTTLSSRDIQINGVGGVNLLLDLDGQKKYEYIFVKDYALYQFEANDPTLFSDLDTIVKSFRILD